MLKAWVIKVVSLAAAIAALLLLPWPTGGLIAAAVLFLTLVMGGWGVFNVNSSLWAKTLWRGRPANRVALTFDDGPDPVFTPAVLDVLRAKGVAAAFFVVGKRIRAHPELARRLREEGHLLGNHSDSHGMWINFSLAGRLGREIDAAGAAVEAAAGVRPRLYRAPHGFKNPALGDALRSRGMTAVGWQVRAFDAVRGDAQAIARRIIRGAKPGGVLLLHDGAGLQGNASREATIAALPVIIDGLRERGFEIVRLDELLEVEPYENSAAS